MNEKPLKEMNITLNSGNSYILRLYHATKEFKFRMDVTYIDEGVPFEEYMEMLNEDVDELARYIKEMEDNSIN